MKRRASLLGGRWGGGGNGEEQVRNVKWERLEGRRGEGGGDKEEERVGMGSEASSKLPAMRILRGKR